MASSPKSSFSGWPVEGGPPRPQQGLEGFELSLCASHLQPGIRCRAAAAVM